MSVILVIEDNADNLELMTYLLSAFGHTALVAGDGRKGLELARREKPDLVLCDIQMPGMNGFEVAGALQSDKDLAHIPRVAVTALAMVGDRDRILAAGFQGYIPKPIVPEAFVPTVEKHLRGAPKTSRPYPPDSEAAAGPETVPARGQSVATILVVDDSPANVSLARIALEPAGYRVIEAPNAHVAVEEARKGRPALILCDVHMPRGDGYQCFRLCKADPELRAIPFVFISSAVLEEEVRRRCIEMGAARFLARPLELAEMLGHVQDVLATARRGRTGRVGGAA